MPPPVQVISDSADLVKVTTAGSLVSNPLPLRVKIKEVLFLAPEGEDVLISGLS